MIRSFKHRGLKALYDGRTERWISPGHLKKLERILSELDQAQSPEDLNIPGFRLHPLKGRRKGCYAVWVSGNWRVVFRFEGINVVDVDYVDYH